MLEQTMRKEVYQPGAACVEEVVQACGEYEEGNPTAWAGSWPKEEEGVSFQQTARNRRGEWVRDPGWQAETGLHFEAERELEELEGTTTWRRVGRRPQEVMRRR